MLSWLANKMISFSLSRLRVGDLRPTLLMDSPDVRMRFPGDSSWAGEIRGRSEHERWLQRFARVGIQIFPDEVVAGGFPWNMTVCVRGHDYLDHPRDGRVYDNRYVLWAHLRWGRVKDYEVYEDTLETARFDRWLTSNEAALAA
jgi:ketosteroid isomerase-like protein